MTTTDADGSSYAYIVSTDSEHSTPYTLILASPSGQGTTVTVVLTHSATSTATMTSRLFASRTVAPKASPASTYGSTLVTSTISSYAFDEDDSRKNFVRPTKVMGHMPVTTRFCTQSGVNLATGTFSEYPDNLYWFSNTAFAPQPVWEYYAVSLSQTLMHQVQLTSATQGQQYQVILTYGAFYFVPEQSYPSTMIGNFVISDHGARTVLANYNHAPSGLCVIDGTTFRRTDYYTDDASTIFETRETTRTYTATATANQDRLDMHFVAYAGAENEYWYIRNMNVYAVAPC
ncbi:uncharacterized protein V1510DRAFT_418700 [Dipodascopsis tothii]|uniref:uncharacterized protein n=1 Tax=Dipodascopsis tothii TaxID=44089 RepID=UPI0034CEA30C